MLVLQILLTSHYYTAILNWSSAITYALAAFVMGILTLKFFLWYNTNRRNFVVLLYGISTMAVSINMIIYLVFVSGTLSGMPAERNPQSQAPGILFPSNTTMGTVQSMWAISFLVSFILLWTSTVILLHHYSQRLGRLKFWSLLIIPLADSSKYLCCDSPTCKSATDSRFEFYINIQNRQILPKYFWIFAGGNNSRHSIRYSVLDCSEKYPS